MSLDKKIAEITALAYSRVGAGIEPENAWNQTLKELYTPEKLAPQMKHTCPNWAFAAFCHTGNLKQVRNGCSPASEKSSSAVFALKGLECLIANPSLATNKAVLKRMVFGEKGKPGYRTPNHEIEVLLALWEAGAFNTERYRANIEAK